MLSDSISGATQEVVSLREHLSALEGAVRGQGERADRMQGTLTSLADEMDQRLAAVQRSSQRVRADLEPRVDGVESRLDELEPHCDRLEGQLLQLDANVA